jgi:hypothetical protein
MPLVVLVHLLLTAQNLLTHHALTVAVMNLMVIVMLV